MPQEPAEAWAKGLPGVFESAEPPLKDAWRRLLEQRVPARPGQLRGQPYARLRNEIATLAAALRSVPSHFPLPPKAGEAFDPVIERRRRSFLEQAAALVGAQAGRVVDDGDRRVGHERTGGVGDRAFDGTRELSRGWRCGQHQDQPAGHSPRVTPRHALLRER